MKAVVKARAEPGLWLEEVPVPEVRGDDVLIRVLKASICGTDLHIYNWDAWAQKTIPVPMTIGHEFVGVVHDVGDYVKGFATGDLVVGEGHITCGHCRNCLAGRRHLCPNTQGVGVNRPGAWRSLSPFHNQTPGTPIRRSRSMSFPVSIRLATLCIPRSPSISSAKMFSSPAQGRLVAWLCRFANKPAPATSSSPISIRIVSNWRAKWVSLLHSMCAPKRSRKRWRRSG